MTAAVTPTAKARPKDPAPGPGPSDVRRVVFWGVVAVLAAALAWGLYAMASKPTGLQATDPQSWLPKSMDRPVDQVLVGTVAHPALTVEGEPVKVETPTFSALAVVNGPVVPGEGLPYQQRFITSTWTISISHLRGIMPISLADFDTIDHLQTVYKPVLVPDQPPLPTALHTGQDLSLKIRAVVPVGEGLFRWAPDGDHIVAKWDYQVEND